MTEPREPLPMSEPPPSRKRATQLMGSLMARLAHLQIVRPWAVIFFVLAVSAFFAWRASRLELRTRYDQLLPDSQPSVIELHRVEKRANDTQTAMLLLEGADEKVLREFGDAIVVKLGTLGPDLVTSVQDGIQGATKFLQPRAGLFLEREDLEKLKDDVDARWDWEVSHALGTSLDEDDTPPPALNREEFEKRFHAKLEAKTGGRKVEQYKDGYYERKDGKALVVIAGSPAPAGDLTWQKRSVDAMHAAVDAVQASKPEFKSVHVGWAGVLVTGLIEYGAVHDDLLRVGALGVLFVLSVVVLYFMRFRQLVVMGVTIACGLAWTFGLTQLVIGHLNVATGFLFSIICGNGINVGIIYTGRYYEEKRNGATTAEAVRIAHDTTWPSTLVAAIASAAAYSSLGVTDFRAFRQFAMIGAGGMIVCWLVTVLTLPTLMVLLDRRSWPQDNGNLGFFARVRRYGVPYGKAFAAIVPVIARPLVLVGAVVAIVGTIFTVRYVRNDPMEYDLGKIQNDKSEMPELHRTWEGVNEILGQFPSAMVVMANNPAQADELQRILQKRWDAAPADAKPFEAVHSIFEFIPDDQEAKLPTLLALGEKLRHAHERHYVSEADFAQIAQFLPPDDLKPFGVADLPEDVARPFTEKDGTRGNLVLIEPRADQSTDDLHYLIRYADSFRETRLKDGTVLRGSGHAVIFADILTAVVHEVPRAISLSLGMTLFAVFLTFRRGSHSATVIAALLVGIVAVGAFMHFAKIRINLFNFAALPITFGIGVDYAVNVMQRYHADGSRDILSALRTTGGAVVLCSLTTMLGYFALVGSHNQGIRSLGEVAVVGEIACLASAILVLPAGWYLLERRKRKAEGEPLTQPPLPPE